MLEQFLLITSHMFFVFGINSSLLVVGSMIVDFKLYGLSFSPYQLIPIITLIIGLIGLSIF